MLTWVALLALALFSGASYFAARRKALAATGGRAAALHSLPGYYGGFVALWVGVPAALVVLAAASMGDRLESAILRAAPPTAIAGLDAEQKTVFFDDALAIANGGQPSQTAYQGAQKTALSQTVARARSTRQQIATGAMSAAALLALTGLFMAYPKIRPDFRARNRVEAWIAGLFIACSVTAILTTVGIVSSLVWESWRFFQSVSPVEFLFGLDWDPQIAMRADQYGSQGAFGAIPLFAGTFLIMMIAMLVAAPVGLFSAIYLSEYAGPWTRALVKPMLEILAGVPTVVYGFFAALTVGPLFRSFFNALGAMMLGGPLNGLGLYLGGVQNQMALVAGAVMGIMLIPFVSSLSDDIINAVPQSLRDGSLAMGATRSETVKQIVLPAALPGIMAAMLLAISRAVGETMIVTMAAGLQAKTTINPLDTVTTVTVQIVTLLTGDQEFDSPKTLAAFGLGLTLFVVTLALNVIAQRIVQKYREQYD